MRVAVLGPLDCSRPGCLARGAGGEALARRVAQEAGGDLDARIDRAWWLALSRAPAAEERAAAASHMARQRERYAVQDAATADARSLASLCHVLINLNEFIYVD